jgi:hypothetical protein
VFEDRRLGLRLSYPPGLRASTKLDRGGILHLLTPLRGTQRHLRESMDLGAFPAAGKTLQKSFDEVRNDLTNDGARVLDVRDAKLGTLPAKRMIYTRRGDLGDGRQFTAKLAFYIAQRGDDMIYLYVRANDENFDRFHAAAQDIISTVEWFDPEQPRR